MMERRGSRMPLGPELSSLRGPGALTRLGGYDDGSPKPRNPRLFDTIEGRRSYTQGVEDTFRRSRGCVIHF